MANLPSALAQSAREILTRDQLAEALDYCPETGVFTWAHNAPVKRWVGTEAGSLARNGYVMINLFKVRYLAHRLAWLHFYGMWPTHALDHKDRNKANNKIENLREATQGQNLANAVRKRKTNDLPKGVYPCDGKYIAKLNKNYKTYQLGRFATVEEARSAYIAGAKLHFGEFACEG